MTDWRRKSYNRLPLWLAVRGEVAAVFSEERELVSDALSILTMSKDRYEPWGLAGKL